MSSVQKAYFTALSNLEMVFRKGNTIPFQITNMNYCNVPLLFSTSLVWSRENNHRNENVIVQHLEHGVFGKLQR